jgi:hypothetical protein
VMQNSFHLQMLFRYYKRNKWTENSFYSFQSKVTCMVFAIHTSFLLCNAGCGGPRQCWSRNDKSIFHIVCMTLGRPEPLVLSPFSSWNLDDDTCINSLRNSQWEVFWLCRLCFFSPNFKRLCSCQPSSLFQSIDFIMTNH